MAGFTIQLSKSCFVIIAKSKPGCVHHICEPCPSQIVSFLEPSLLPHMPSLAHPCLAVPLVSVPSLDHQACSDFGAVFQYFGPAGIPTIVSSVPEVSGLSSGSEQGQPLWPGKGPHSCTMEKWSGLCQNMVTFFWLNPLKKDNIVIFSNDCLSWITSALV